MRSVVPSDSATVPLPDHVPSKPANGPDWAWPADTESISAAPMLAALIACPKRLEPNRFILRFPVKNDVLNLDTSRRIKVLVSPNYIRFKPVVRGNSPRCGHCTGSFARYTNSFVLANGDFEKCQKAATHHEFSIYE